MSLPENLEAALKEAERVCKKQKVCAGKTADCLSKLAQTLQTAQLRLGTSTDGTLDAQDLLKTLQSPELLKDLTESTKDLHSAVNKLGKV